MNILVVGFGHFAGVVASCLAQRGHGIWQTDEEPPLIREGQKRAEDEPGYVPVAYSLFENGPDVVWVAYDCPLDANGLPVIDEILARIMRWHEHFPVGVPFVVSCQWPVGTMATLERLCEGRTFIYVMENVRVGHAIQDFQNPDTIVIGTRRPIPEDLQNMLAGFTGDIFGISPESAEMVKHTTNAFMALQIAFINEIAQLSERVGANPLDVAEGLMSDWRVNGNAPLHPGGPFGGGSLSRDVKVLERLTLEHDVYAPLLQFIHTSNDARTVKA